MCDPVTATALVTGGANVASNLLGANAKEDAASKEAEASRYGVDVGAATAAKQQALEQALATQSESFTGTQNAEQRALQAKLQAEGESATQAEQESAQAFQGKQSAASAALQKFLQAESEQATANSQEKAQIFQGGQTEKELAAEKAAQESAQAFQGGQTAEQIAAEKEIQGTAAENKTFQASESAASRALQQALQTQAETFQGSEAQKERDITTAQNAAKLGAYNTTTATGASQMASGENALASETAAAPSELQDYQKSIMANALPEQERQEAQQKSALAKQGVTGSAAAILEGRATGESNRQLAENANALNYQDAVARRLAQTNYSANKAATGQRATTSQFGG